MDILDYEKLSEFLSDKKFDALIHLAAHKNASESMKKPEKYNENIDGMANVLSAMVEFNIPKIIFSSTAAVYGAPEYLPMNEKHSTNPINYYGETKLICEKMIQKYSKDHKISYSIFRYFNVAGDAGLKFKEKNAHNLFPAIQEVLSGKVEYLEIYGDDYDTKDGTCIRDYIHVEDIARAHVLALDNKGSDIFNLGTNKGNSVLDIINEFEKALNKEIPKEITKRREGDPADLIADAKKTNKQLKWKAEKSLEDMVRSSLF